LMLCDQHSSVGFRLVKLELANAVLQAIFACTFGLRPRVCRKEWRHGPLIPPIVGVGPLRAHLSRDWWHVSRL